MKKTIFVLLTVTLLFVIGYANNNESELSEIIETELPQPGKVSTGCIMTGGENSGKIGIMCVSGIGNSCSKLTGCIVVDATGLSLLSAEEKAAWPNTDYLANEEFVAYMLSIGVLDFEE